MTTDFQQLARWLHASKCTVAFSGAGISTESGLPDFRSPGGVWANNRTVYFQEFLDNEVDRQEYWRQKSMTHHEFVKAKPNVTHRLLAQWESLGLIYGVITQNIDGLHQQAGSQRLLELHGTAREVGCLDCGARFPADPYVAEFESTGIVPRCPKCKGLLKHATISFGQSLDSFVLDEAYRWSERAEVFLTLGSSLVVEPAASLPVVAKRHGARLVIVNRDPTPLDRLADVRIFAEIGATMQELQEALESIAADDTGE